MNGLLVIDKPGGMTSRDVVDLVQKWFPRKTKIGHTGTLDPLATGVLVVCIGAATRLADFVQAMGKTYHSRFRLGAVSTTDDADGELTLSDSGAPPSSSEIESALGTFIGSVEQRPPAYSAVKLDGRRAHSLARQGQVVEIAPRTVRIDAIRLIRYERPFLEVEIDCGKGTYIRSIARDLGARLGCGGMVETLRRVRIGPFVADQGVPLSASQDEAQAALLPMMSAVSGMTRTQLTPDEVRRFRTGQTIPLQMEELCPDHAVSVLNCSGELVGIGSIRRGGVKPDIVFRA